MSAQREESSVLWSLPEKLRIRHVLPSLDLLLLEEWEDEEDEEDDDDDDDGEGR